MEKHLYERLGLRKGLTSIIGSGGKTTLIRRLAGELKEDGFTVIVTTSTRIFIPDYCPLVCNSDASEEIPELLKKAGVVSVGRPTLTPQGAVKLEVPAGDFKKMKLLADFVLVEADGSKHRPLKAHADYEPVIPECSDRVVQVVGIDGIGKKVSEAVHRAELFSRFTGLGPDDAVTSEAAAEVINRERLCDILYFAGRSEENLESAEKLKELVEVPVVMEV